MEAMKLSEFLIDIGRPVAYYPALARLLGDVNEAVFVCQFAYWHGKGADPEGWIYKTSEEITEETGLSYREQATVRKSLKSRDLLEEKYARLDHQMFFRVKWDSLNALWGIPETRKAQLGNDGLRGSLNSNTETTTENTSKKGDLVDGILAYSKPPTAKQLMAERAERELLRLQYNFRGAAEPEQDALLNFLLREEKVGKTIEKFAEGVFRDEWWVGKISSIRKVMELWPRFTSAPAPSGPDYKLVVAPTPEELAKQGYVPMPRNK